MYEIEEEYWWYVARRTLLVEILKNCLDRMRKPGTRRILDYGCGTGANLHQFSSVGNTYGVDVSPTALQYCRQRGLTNLKQLDAEGLSVPSNPFKEPFDLVTMLDVLEHVPDDSAALRRIRSWLQPDGMLVLTVPAYEFLWSGEDYVSEHKRRYTRSSLTALLDASGFKCIKASYFNTLLFPLQVVAILWKRLVDPRSMYRTNLEPIPPALNAFLREVMGLEARLIPKVNLPFGGSLLCCAVPEK